MRFLVDECHSFNLRSLQLLAKPPYTLLLNAIWDGDSLILNGNHPIHISGWVQSHWCATITNFRPPNSSCSHATCNNFWLKYPFNHSNYRTSIVNIFFGITCPWAPAYPPVAIITDLYRHSSQTICLVKALAVCPRWSVFPKQLIPTPWRVPELSSQAYS